MRNRIGSCFQRPVEAAEEWAGSGVGRCHAPKIPTGRPIAKGNRFHCPRTPNRRQLAMRRDLRALAAAVALFIGMATAGAALAQKPGGVLKVYFFDSPASMSIHEETTAAGEGPMMGVFNNLVLYKQDVLQSSLQSIVPDLASDWSWDEDKTQLTFRLREGVRWHDGKPLTAKDVRC